MSVTPSQYRILIVDDNVDAAELLQMILSIGGYDVRLSFDGENAFKEALRFRPHAVLTDIVMPGMSGYELAALLRQAGFGRATLIIAISGFTGSTLGHKSGESDFDAFMAKPVAYADVCQRLDAHLQRSCVLSESPAHQPTFLP